MTRFCSVIKGNQNFITGATVFGYCVNGLERYGVVEFKRVLKVISIKKIDEPTSHYAVLGLYFYYNDVV